MKTFESQSVNLLRKELEYRNYSLRTIITYCELMSNLERQFHKSLAEISATEFKDYLHKSVIENHLSTSSVNQRISAFKIFVKDILNRQWEDFTIKRPRRNKKLPVVLSIEEVERLIGSTKNIKHKAILMLTYSAGLRRMELMSITPDCIDSDRMQVRIKQGKGKKDRFTILSKKTLEILRLYYKLERPSKYLFEPNGKKGYAMAEETLNVIVKKTAIKAGINKNISFHTLRHSFATHLLENGVNIKLIQNLLGHNSLKTTSVYLHLTKVDPSNIQSPLESMNV